MPSPRRGCWRALDWRTCRRTIWWPDAVAEDWSSGGCGVIRLVRSSSRTTCRLAIGLAWDRWRRLAPVVIHDVPRSPVEQMAIDEQWAREVAAGDRPASLRFWEWSSPAVVVGRFQSIPERGSCGRGGTTGVHGGPPVHGWRHDGGPAGRGDHLFAVRRRDGSWTAWTRRRPTGCGDSWLIDALRGLGVDARFQGLNDIAVRLAHRDGRWAPAAARWVDRNPRSGVKRAARRNGGFPRHRTVTVRARCCITPRWRMKLDGALMARLLKHLPGETVRQGRPFGVQAGGAAGPAAPRCKAWGGTA